MPPSLRHPLVQTGDEVLERIFAVLPTRQSLVSVDIDVGGTIIPLTFKFDTMTPDDDAIRIIGYGVDDSVVNLVIFDDGRPPEVLLPR